jgi:hypothetical protein
MRKPIRQLAQTPDTVTVVPEQPQPAPQPAPPVAPKPWRPHWVIATNLLADAGVTPEVAYRAPMPNLELEYLFNPHFSIALSGLYKDFFGASGYDKWNVTAYTLEGRYRLLPDGHYGGLYIGLFGRVGDYNFVPSDTQGAGSRTGKYQSAGLSLGYTWPFARHWILEAGAGYGYRWTKVRHYTHEGKKENYLTTETTDNGLDLTGLFLRIGYRFK